MAFPLYKEGAVPGRAADRGEVFLLSKVFAELKNNSFSSQGKYSMDRKYIPSHLGRRCPGGADEG